MRAVVIIYFLLSHWPHSSLTHSYQRVMAAPQEESPATKGEKQPLYHASTQFRNWRFSFEGLAQVRGAMNEVAVAAIRRKIEADEVLHVAIAAVSC